MPPIFLLGTRLTADELQKWEEKIPTLTRDVRQAQFIVGKISQKARAQFELRKLRLSTEEASPMQGKTSFPRARKRKIVDTREYDRRSVSPTESDVGSLTSDGESQELPGTPVSFRDDTVKVVKLAWLQDSLSRGKLLDYRLYLVFEAVRESHKAPPPSSAELLRRAREVAAGSSQTATSPHTSYGRHREGGHHNKAPSLLPQSTTEEHAIAKLPPIPDYLNIKYSCQRPTFVHPPNEAFIDKLKEVRELRAMRGDHIGVRAYSTAIASLSAYPYKLKSPLEIPRLPGCGERYAELFAEFENTGQLDEIEQAASDPKMSAIKIFYNIHGVSAVTAEEFWRKGWRDLDDVIEYGWKSISRVQQIGVKYYDEFLQKIPRAESEHIANTVLEYANKLRPGYHMTIVGGYRRGKKMSGDVDLMLSHPDEHATHNFIRKLVTSLEEARFITHTLSLSEHNSERGQRPTSFKPSGSGGTGFDTLDKALAVWQDPSFKPTSSSCKNPNPHRRVDILISPWKTTGCAVLGWSSETTFQRDLRRYCKDRGLKFDSSGIRSRESPYNWVDLEEGENGPPQTMEEAERRVFAGLELVWRPPEERCTG
ncbi:hypothetical protein N0V93_006601 [Gnomoniopsis smithogilvyi]|uniref:DNA polymerase n=1 Tax=Gnomoniopsis smithogilvyi TaxID=1191159 RepID=A0A9W8YQ52_9PEZI|nr:hypothetical protein N0V93_006601 [Gnomoniopsis smithogilvyi]